MNRKQIKKNIKKIFFNIQITFNNNDIEKKSLYIPTIDICNVLTQNKQK